MLTALSGVAYRRGGEADSTRQGLVRDRLLSWLALSRRCYRRGSEPEHTWTRSVHDLYHHAQHFYSTTLSHTANCYSSDKQIWTVSCISHISHPPCYKLAEVVTLSSPPFNVKLLVWLPSSCIAAPLIAKATTQMKEMAFRQPIRQYQILCCYRVSRPVCWIYSCRSQYIQ